jgi:hypothetical protein
MGKVDRFEWYGLGKKYIPQTASSTASRVASKTTSFFFVLSERKPNPKTSQMALWYSIVNKMLSLS